ncbi:SDR family oxidoreductase [Sphingobacterium rhinopitheci]|uniref:SDR family oxidoreductase n=1 Tax=Sphingobacterium rhinopitheci TaxID=2781960 RepID=UPI001F51EE1A|nr:SDR family oxidoreductase [Sphingobacterium rhinopitheci]MCI0922675.1 SDR family oxidoreductase [Sphingobacterium rhinopitheci]
MILVTGATGNLGKSTINFLIQNGTAVTDIVALVRDEAKATELKAKGVNIKIADYNDLNSLKNAFNDVDKLLLVSGSDIVNRTKQHENVVTAAKKSGVKHIYYTSSERKNDTETSPIAFLEKSHIDTEIAIKSSGLDYTIFRNNLYLDALPMFFGEQVLSTGIFLPAGETKGSFASRNDMAEAIAKVIVSEGHENKEYSLSNTEQVSMQEIAQYVSKIVGQEVNYISPSADIYLDSLTKAGVPNEFIGLLAGFAEAIKQGEFLTEKTHLEQILGRKPTSAKEYLTQVYSA